ncbi:hypothetical protein SASPL_115435 [Salvia splendens]|uniref:Secreted protein n=1 Tax=Salvia splendens TaxID=180675 RepID=A0A8X9A0A6_SALSN|nr:hypothetical protein SASPL_115435 [Salvia splendens]
MMLVCLCGAALRLCVSAACWMDAANCSVVVVVDLRSDRDSGDGATNSTNADGDAEGAEGVGANNRDSSSSYQRYDMYTAGCSLDRAGPSFLVASVDCIHTSALLRKYLRENYPVFSTSTSKVLPCFIILIWSSDLSLGWREGVDFPPVDGESLPFRRFPFFAVTGSSSSNLCRVPAHRGETNGQSPTPARCGRLGGQP